jgi:hypothetical protein
MPRTSTSPRTGRDVPRTVRPVLPDRTQLRDHDLAGRRPGRVCRGHDGGACGADLDAPVGERHHQQLPGDAERAPTTSTSPLTSLSRTPCRSANTGIGRRTSRTCWCTRATTTSATSPRSLNETTLFSTYFVENYASPKTRVPELAFRSASGRDNERFGVVGIRVRCRHLDRVHLTTTHPGGGGFSEYFFCRGRPLRRRHQGGAAFTNVTLTVDVSPASFYSTSPFGTVDGSIPTAFLNGVDRPSRSQGAQHERQRLRRERDPRRDVQQHRAAEGEPLREAAPWRSR